MRASRLYAGSGNENTQFLTCDNPIHNISVDSTRTFDCFIPFFLSFTCLCLVEVEQEISFVHTALRCVAQVSFFRPIFTAYFKSLIFCNQLFFHVDSSIHRLNWTLLFHFWHTDNDSSWFNSDAHFALYLSLFCRFAYFSVFQLSLQHSFKACIKRA